MSPPRIDTYRRHLPHWRADEATYFVTWRLHPRQPDLRPAERNLVATAMRYFDGTRYRLDAFVIMPDHVHLLVQPFAGFRLESLVASWKSYTAHQLRRQRRGRGAIWLEEYYDRIARDRRSWERMVRYIAGNPRKRWAEEGARYPWVWVRED